MLRLRSGICCDRICKTRTTVQHKFIAARVASETDIGLSDLCPQWLALAALHSTPRWLWPALVSRLIEEGGTVETARRQAQKLEDAGEPPAWVVKEGAARCRPEGVDCIRTNSEKPDQTIGSANSERTTTTTDPVIAVCHAYHREYERGCALCNSDAPEDAISASIERYGNLYSKIAEMRPCTREGAAAMQGCALLFMTNGDDERTRAILRSVREFLQS